VDGSGVGKIPLLLGLHLGKDVRLKSVLTFDLAGTGKLEALFGTGFGFHFGHIRLFLNGLGENYFF
jgi:hypothetical protein